jgi:uncharacterized repeat protein (TIGR03803 family)
MNKSSARSAIGETFVFLFVLAAAAGAQTYSVLTSFDGTNGSAPFATPLIDSLGNVFGTTVRGGGSANCGVVYELVNNGAGSYTNHILHNFTCGDDEGYPYGSVLMDSAGNIYGTTHQSGAYGAGVVYELVNHGGGSYKFEVIHAFSAKGKDGDAPMGDLGMFKGSLYGITQYGGGGGCENGCGTVYRLTKTGGKWVETVLHLFYNHPLAGVTFDSDGNIYGTLYHGGSFRYGTVFKLSPQGGSLAPPVSSGSYKETVLHTFDGKADGCDIYSGVVLDSVGNLYGTAAGCGEYDDGTVYELRRAGSKYEFRVILTFNGTNGETPYDEHGHLAVDSAGNVYGTVGNGPIDNADGTAFELAAGSFLYTDLHDFHDHGTDGSFPYGGVSLDSLGNLYGTTIEGGSYDGGTVWQISNP